MILKCYLCGDEDEERVSKLLSNFYNKSTNVNNTKTQYSNLQCSYHW